MPSAREMRLRIRSVKSIAQVTKALETVSASKVRRSVAAVTATRPYSQKAWKLLLHVARQPGSDNLHPLLTQRDQVDNVLVLMVSSDRGLAGAYNVNIVRYTLEQAAKFVPPVAYIAIGRKGRDMLARRRRNILADFSDLPAAPSFADVSAIGRLATDLYLKGEYDEVYIAFTEFNGMMRQTPVLRKILPLQVVYEGIGEHNIYATHKSSAVFSYEPDQNIILDQIVPRFTALQVYQSILSAAASEHAARMVAMRNASENAHELIDVLQLQYNKARQNSITSEILDIAGGAEALRASLARQ